MLSYSLSELRDLPTGELVARHDAVAQTTSVGVAYYLDELARRDAAEAADRLTELTQEMAHLTRTVARLTVLIAILTAVTLLMTLLP
jgi:hypothetical protein